MASFVSVCFSGRANLKQIEKKNGSIGGPGACSFGKFLKFHILQWPF